MAAEGDARVQSLEVLERAPFGLHRYELLPDDRLLFRGANATANEMLGVDHQQFLGRTIEEAFPALTATEIPTRYREVARTGVPWQTEQVAYDEQGITGAFQVRAVPLGQREVAVYFNDITALLRIEHALRSKQAELDGYFTHALDLLCIATTDGRFKRLNPEWEKVLGFPLAELEGQRFLDHVHPDDLPATMAALQQLAGRSTVINFVNRYRCRDGSYRFIEWRSFPAADQVYAIARDVTERILATQKLEEALFELTQKSQEMESLLYVTTHDLRSPLVNVQGFASRIARTLVELEALANRAANEPITGAELATHCERLRSSLGYITGSASKMDRLIHGLLELSRLGRRPLQWVDVDMATLWKKTVELQRHLITEAGVELQAGELPNCQGDAFQLEQVLGNLLDNAIKYRDRARPCVITFSGETLPDKSLRYRFGDTGRGIEPTHIERIWELFHRLAPSSDLPGDGIGLTAVRQIMLRHGGTISVKSQPGMGTEFELRLPARREVKASRKE